MARARVRLRRGSGGYAVANCPGAWHALRSPTLEVRLSNPDRFACKSCGAGGDVLDFAGLAHGVATLAEQFLKVTGEALASKVSPDQRGRPAPRPPRAATPAPIAITRATPRPGAPSLSTRQPAVTAGRRVAAPAGLRLRTRAAVQLFKPGTGHAAHTSSFFPPVAHRLPTSSRLLAATQTDRPQHQTTPHAPRPPCPLTPASQPSTSKPPIGLPNPQSP